MDGPLSTSFCDVCNAAFSGPEPAKQHYASDKHRRREQMFAEGGLTNNVNSPAPISLDNIPEKEYEFGGYRGHCFVCDKELTSKVVADQHLNGKNHRKARDRWQLLKLERDNKRGTPSQTIVGALSSGGLSKDQGRSLSPSSVAPKVKEADKGPVSNKPYYFDVDEGKGRCYACDLEFRSMPVFQKHRRTEEHENMTLKWMKKSDIERQEIISRRETTGKCDSASPPRYVVSPLDGTRWYTCDVCNVRVNTATQLRIHEQSPKHLRELERAGSGLGREPGSADKTLWVTCDVCDKRLNSQQQLMIHRRSHGIKDDAPVAMTTRVSPPPIMSTPRRPNGYSPSARGSADDELAEISRALREVKLVEENRMPEPEVQRLSEKPIPMRLRRRLKDLREDCKIMGCTYHCDDCDKHHTGKTPYEQHLKSKGHAKKLNEAKEDAAKQDENRLFPTFYAYCKICQVPFDAEASAESHYKGKKHMEKFIKSSKAPLRELPMIKKNIPSDDCEDPYEIVKTFARYYQIELYEKAMMEDTVCFLPTGTGKTLVAVMVISNMLKANPRRPVVFLVDKVLLAFQQSEVIKKELGDMEFERWDESSGLLVRRPPRIALVCRGQQDTDGLPIWEQDVIVATAAYFENLMMESIVRWEDQSLVVLDESHHCVKDHPYKRVMKDYHAALADVALRPKVLGLTASPAGKHNVLETKAMLHTLLGNLGHVKMAAVESHQSELKKYRSNTQLVIKKVNLSKQEELFQVELQKYISACFKRLTLETNIKQFLVVDESFADEALTIETERELLEVIDFVEANDQKKRVYAEALKIHVKDLVSAILGIREQGLSFAFDDLCTLNDDSYSGSFSKAKEMNLPCEDLMNIMGKYKSYRGMDIKCPKELDAEEMPVVKQLISEILTSVDWDKDYEDWERPVVLVLVRQRKYAKNLALILNSARQLKEKDIESVCVVGHAAKTSEGMSVNQQKRVMDEIKNHEYQVIVATSIAEEGVDLPECELVVQMDPPNNVKSLVQIRGRARKKNSRFVALCRDDGQVNSLQNLQKRERFMILAVQDIVDEQNLRQK